MKKDRYTPERSFFGGRCGFFGDNTYSVYSRKPRESMWHFFNRILFNRGSIERDPRPSVLQKFNDLLYNRGSETGDD